MTHPGPENPGPPPYPAAGGSPFGQRPAFLGYPVPPPTQLAPQPPRSMPGWLWPTLAAAALVIGLIGGVLGGALVLGSASLGEDDLPPIGGPAPLAADNDSIAAVAAKVLPSTVQVRVTNSEAADAEGATGSGFVVDKRGHVITNNHVVAAADGGGRVVVVDSSGRPHDAEIVGRSAVYDIAVLDVAAAGGLRPAALGSSRQMQVGQTVVAIGSPLGLSSTVTSGIVSALDRAVTAGPADASSFINAVQTDAAINPGNSGGPLVNLRGQVVGVNSAIATTGGVLGGDGGNIGVGFAIPMEQVRITAEQILDTGRAEYPVIGANVDTGDSSTGARVVEVPNGTPADQAGLRVDDRIIKVDGRRIADGISLIVAIRSHRPGDSIELTVVRDGGRRTVTVTLDAKVG